MPYKNELSTVELSQSTQDWLNDGLFSISELEPGELRQSNGDLASLSFNELDYRNLSETEEE